MATERKQWQPNEKQKLFLEALMELKTATFRELKDYIFKNNGVVIATGSVNTLLTKDLVASREEEIKVETTTIYHYNSGDIVENKVSVKKEKVYYLPLVNNKFGIVPQTEKPLAKPSTIEVDEAELDDMED